MALNFPIELYVLAARQKDRNRRQAMQDAMGIGENLGQGITGASEAVETLKKKRDMDRLMFAIQQPQELPVQGPSLPGMDQAPAGIQPTATQPGMMAHNPGSNVMDPLSRLFPEIIQKSLLSEIDPLIQSQIYRNYSSTLNSGKKGPSSFQQIYADKVNRGEMTMDEALEDYRTKAFPLMRTDPSTGALVQVTGTGSVKNVGTPGIGNSKDPQDAVLSLRKVAPKFHDRFVAILDETYPDKNQFMKQSIESTGAAAKAKAILKDPKPSQVALKSLGFNFAIMSGSNSQLSDAERASFEQPLSLIGKVVNGGYKLVAGDLSPKMRRDLLQLAETLELKSKIQGKRIIDSQKRRAKKELGRFYTPGLDQSFPTFDDLSVSSEDVVGQLGGISTGGLSPSEQAEMEQLKREIGE